MRFLYASLLVAVAVGFHFVALYTGLYALQMREGLVWFDNVLHVLAGGAFALMWFSLLSRLLPKTTLSVQALSTLAFVLLVAIGWEAFEYGFYLVFKSGALGLTVYEPSWKEALVDSISTFAGGVLLACGRGAYLLASARGPSV